MTISLMTVAECTTITAIYKRYKLDMVDTRRRYGSTEYADLWICRRVVSDTVCRSLSTIYHRRFTIARRYHNIINCTRLLQYIVSDRWQSPFDY